MKRLQNHWTEIEISTTCKWEDRSECRGAYAVRHTHLIQYKYEHTSHSTVVYIYKYFMAMH